MMEAVHYYGGYIAQLTGDGIFALFGAPVAHEDHPQRALFAALRLQDEMRRYSAKLRVAGNLPVEARVGVNAGEVVVRSITTGHGDVEYAPIGHSLGRCATALRRLCDHRPKGGSPTFLTSAMNLGSERIASLIGRFRRGMVGERSW